MKRSNNSVTKNSSQQRVMPPLKRQKTPKTAKMNANNAITGIVSKRTKRRLRGPKSSPIINTCKYLTTNISAVDLYTLSTVASDSQYMHAFNDINDNILEKIVLNMTVFLAPHLRSTMYVLTCTDMMIISKRFNQIVSCSTEVWKRIYNYMVYIGYQLIIN
jgi:hypothetical protein